MDGSIIWHFFLIKVQFQANWGASIMAPKYWLFFPEQRYDVSVPLSFIQ